MPLLACVWLGRKIILTPQDGGVKDFSANIKKNFSKNYRIFAARAGALGRTLRQKTKIGSDKLVQTYWAISRRGAEKWPQWHWRLTYRLALFEFIREHATVLGIALLVLVGNALTWQKVLAEAAWENDLFGMDKGAVVKIVAAVAPYTPALAESPNQVESSLLAEEEDFVQKPALTSLAVVTPGPTEKIIYTVKAGDTVLGIAQQFNLHVASLLEANNIKPQDAGKLAVGTILSIPSEDTSSSLAWLEQAQKAKLEAQQKFLAAKSATKNRSLLAHAAGRVSTREDAAGGFDQDAGGSFIVPVTFTRIARGLGRGHTGIDYDTPIGTPVYAGAAGRVIELTGGWGGGWGRSIELDNGGGWTSRYAHLSNFAVGLGDTVGQGQLIGYSGDTGNSTGPHLHFETRIDGRPVWPPYK